MRVPSDRVSLYCGFGQLGLDEIVAVTVPANWRSRRVMERLGMTRRRQDDFDYPNAPEGPLKRCVIYRLRNPHPSLRRRRREREGAA